jgi:hypothetical protein
MKLNAVSLKRLKDQQTLNQHDKTEGEHPN